MASTSPSGREKSEVCFKGSNAITPSASKPVNGGGVRIRYFYDSESWVHDCNTNGE
jgi:hypothetical protein